MPVSYKRSITTKKEEAKVYLRKGFITLSVPFAERWFIGMKVENVKNKKEYIILFATNLLAVFTTFFLFVFFKHYGLDDYIIIDNLSELHYNALNNGRLALLVLYDMFIEFGFNPVSSQCSMAIVLATMFAFCITSLTERIIELGNIDKSLDKILINLGSLVLLLNVFVVEWFTFVLSYAQWILGIVGAIYAAILMSYNSRLRKIFAVILLCISINAYQIMIVYFAVIIMLFIYLQNENNFKLSKAIKKIVAAAAISIVLMGINIWITSHVVSIYTGGTRYDRLAFSIDNIVQIIKAQRNIWIEGKGILPHGIMALTLCSSVMILGSSARKSRITWQKAIYCFLVYCAAVFVTFIPQMLAMWLTPRSLAPLFCVFSIGAYFIVFWNREEGEYRHKVIAIALMGMFIFANFYYIQKVAISMFQTNMLEKECAKQIEHEIRKYEQTTGIEVEYISFYRDNTPQYKYDDILLKPGEDMLYNVYLVEWGDIYALNFYTNLALEKKSPAANYNKYFSNYNWDCLDLQEQLKFEGNTCHYCVY